MVQHFQTKPKGINSTECVIQLKATQRDFFSLTEIQYFRLLKGSSLWSLAVKEQILCTKPPRKCCYCCQYGQVAKRVDWAL